MVFDFLTTYHSLMAPKIPKHDKLICFGGGEQMTPHQSAACPAYLKITPIHGGVYCTWPMPPKGVLRAACLHSCRQVILLPLFLILGPLLQTWMVPFFHPVCLLLPHHLISFCLFSPLTRGLNFCPTFGSGSAHGGCDIWLCFFVILME